MRKLLFLFVLLFQFGISDAQNTTRDEQLAAQYYQSGEFDKAADLYEKLYSKNPTAHFYTFYLNSLIELKEFSTAEKFIRKQIKRNPFMLSYFVDLGHVLTLAGNSDKAKKEFENAIDKLEPDHDQITGLSNAFIQKKEYDHAIKTLLQGRKLLKGNYGYNFELAEVYQLKNDFTSAVSELLSTLETSEAYLQSVQNALYRAMGEDTKNKKGDILKSQLLKYIQSNSDKFVYSELLIWVYTQEKDFEAAYVQTKALDKRMKEDGTRLMSLASTAESNGDLDVAKRCYEYVIQKGPEYGNYSAAKTELLNLLYTKVTSQGKYTHADLNDLNTQFTVTLNELGKGVATNSLQKKYAHFLGFYMDEKEKAIKMLEELIANPQNGMKFQNECKIELGDILLLSGDMWESSLLYSQVEKAYKDDVLGQEAKLRNARLSYYRGDFQWAQAQLDVLKAATSKLIANDALELSLLITDNTGLDSITAPLMFFARADLLSYQNKDSLALITLDSIQNMFPAHVIADDVLYKKYKITMKQQKFDQAGEFLKQILEKYSYDVLADDALFNLGLLNENYLNNKEKAKELYQELLTKHPGSLYTVEARKRFRALRGDAVN